jgi:hypothetical protein
MNYFCKDNLTVDMCAAESLYFHFSLLLFLTRLKKWTRLLMYWYLNCNYRISVVAGYMAEEVTGVSAFKFMHKDDVCFTIVALRQSK